MNATISIVPAIVKIQDGVPVSAIYDDVYFSREGGEAETNYVFLEGNQLPNRLAGRQRLTIGELGFGTGLNFLMTWRAWRDHAPGDGTLSYIAVEKHPFLGKDLPHLHAAWPELATLSQEFLATYPLPSPGFHRFALDGGRVRLTLLLGEAEPMLRELQAQVDAWYLDGFAPRVNPEMWSDAVFQEMARLSAPEATFATFTAAGAVRRGLQHAGFHTETTKGFGKKRERLVGVIASEAKQSSKNVMPHVQHLQNSQETPQHMRGDNSGLLRFARNDVLIIGAGLAGCSAAYALAGRGARVTLLEKHPGPAAETSANPAGILFPMTALEWNLPTRFYLAGFNYSVALLKQLQRDHAIAGEWCSMVQCPKSEEDATRLPRIPAALGLHESVVRYLTPQETETVTGIHTRHGGLHFPASGWVSLADTCHAMLRRDAITFHGDDAVATLERHGNGWRAVTENGVTHEAETVILANAQAARALAPQHALPLATIRGQTTLLPACPATQSLKTVLCYGGYLTPAHNGAHHLGATYERERDDTCIDAEGHRGNLEKLAACCPDISLPAPSIETLEGWAALRTTSSDRLPLVGMLEPGLYTTLAHGSRGLLSCPLAGEQLAAQLCGEALPLEADLATALRPIRFAV